MRIKLWIPLSVLGLARNRPHHCVTSNLTAHQETVLEYYKEQLAHGRHFELQRSTLAGVSLAISGAIAGELLRKGQLTRDQLPYTVTLLAVGFFAWVFSAKLYERFDFHRELAKLARNQLNPTLEAVRRQAQAAHTKKYPFLSNLKLHLVWNVVYGLVFLFGLISSIVCFVR